MSDHHSLKEHKAIIEAEVTQSFNKSPERAFSRIREAREVLRARAEEFVVMQLRIIEAAIKGGDFETAAKANQWLMEHTPADSEGLRMIESSIDKIKEVGSGKNLGPQINIGFNLGGTPQKALPEVQVIEVKQLEDSDGD